MTIQPGQIAIGDHVLTPLRREAVVIGRLGVDGYLRLRYLEAKVIDEVNLPAHLLYLLSRPKLRRPG